MTALRATLEDGNLLLENPLLRTVVPQQALLIIFDDETQPLVLPTRKPCGQAFCVEEGFEAIGLKDFFGDVVDEQINWEKFFSEK